MHPPRCSRWWEDDALSDDASARLRELREEVPQLRERRLQLRPRRREDVHERSTLRHARDQANSDRKRRQQSPVIPGRVHDDNRRARLDAELAREWRPRIAGRLRSHRTVSSIIRQVAIPLLP